MENWFNNLQRLIDKEVIEVQNIVRTGAELRPKVFFLLYYPKEDTFHNLDIPISGSIFGKDGFNLKELLPYLDQIWQTLKKADFGENLVLELAAVFVFSEGWWIKRDIPVNLSGDELPLPSKQPDRKEAVVCVVQRQKEKFMYFYPYDRIGERIEFSDERTGGPMPMEQPNAFRDIWPPSA